MLALEEWCFDFTVSAPTAAPEVSVDDLLEVAIDWVEVRGLSIGGGFRPAGLIAPGKASTWQWHFGLYRRDGRLVPQTDAEGLEQQLREWCQGRGLEFLGGHRAFTPEETGDGESTGDGPGG